MSQYGFYIDLAKCTGCKTCVIACKDAHSLPVGTNYRKVIEFVEGDWKKDASGAWVQDVRGYYVPIACNECADPACVKVCPTKAHFKRESDGLVLIDDKKCIGCGACAKACPYGAPVLDEIVTRCTSATPVLIASPKVFFRFALKPARSVLSSSERFRSFARSTATMLTSLPCPPAA